MGVRERSQAALMKQLGLKALLKGPSGTITLMAMDLNSQPSGQGRRLSAHYSVSPFLVSYVAWDTPPQTQYWIRR